MLKRWIELMVFASLVPAAQVAQASPFAYVPNGGSGSGNLSVIDTATASVVHTITIDSSLQTAAVSPNGFRVYTASILSGNIYAINAFTNAVVATIPTTPFGVYCVAVNPSGTRLYGLRGDNGLEVVDATTNMTLTTVFDPAFDGMQSPALAPSLHR